MKGLRGSCFYCIQLSSCDNARVCYLFSSLSQTFNVGMGRDWGNNTICSHNQSLPAACLSDLATFHLKGAVDNCCCSNKNHIADKIVMAWYLWHVHVQDVITSCYKWIAVPEFDRTHSSFYRDIWLVANCYLWQSWWRDSDHHCDHVTSLTPEHTLLSPWFSFLSCPLQKKTGTWRESCQQDWALPLPSQEAAVFRIFTDMLVAWCKN